MEIVFAWLIIGLALMLCFQADNWRHALGLLTAAVWWPVFWVAAIVLNIYNLKRRQR